MSHRAVFSLLPLALLACDAGAGAADTTDEANEAPEATPDAGGSAGDAAAPADSAGPMDDATADTAPANPTTREGCDGAALLSVPADRTEPGPWPVGVRTTTIEGLVTEIWYPSVPGSEADAAPATYDLRVHLPEEDQGKIPDEVAPTQVCDCYRDLPLDKVHGPYPIVLFIHGTAAFRTQSLTQMTHWASRGFVVLAADHPKLILKDVLRFNLGADLPGDALNLLDAITATTGDLSFLTSHLAVDRIGLTGHSAGGGGLKGLGGYPGVRVLIPMAAGGSEPSYPPVSTLILAGLDDGIVPYDKQQSAYEASAPPKRLIGLANAGHLAFSDLCAISKEDGGILQVALDHGVEVPELVATLAQDGCMDGQLPPEEGWDVINDATSAAFEGALQCDPAADESLASIAERHEAVAEYKEDLASKR